jgi:hypothetical protein
MVGPTQACSPWRDDLTAEMGGQSKRMGWPRDWNETALGAENGMTWVLAKEESDGAATRG